VLSSMNRPGSKPRIAELILAAPDVNRRNFQDIAKDIRGFVRGMTLYASGSDWALSVSQRLRGGDPRAGQVTSEGPLVIPDLDSIDVTRASSNFFSLNHTTFAEREPLLRDIRAILQAGVRPPSKRIVDVYQEVKTTAGVYYRYEPRSPR